MSDVEWCSDGSAWVRVKEGRKTWIPKDDPFIEKLKSVPTLELLRKISSRDLDHTKCVYYVDAEGKIGIPPDPKMIPAGCIAHEIKDLREADRIAKQLTREMQEQFGHDEFTAYMDQVQADENGNTPRDILRKTEPRSNYERDMIACMLKSLDAEEDARNRVDAHVSFHWRES